MKTGNRTVLNGFELWGDIRDACQLILCCFLFVLRYGQPFRPKWERVNLSKLSPIVLFMQVWAKFGLYLTTG